MSLMTDLKRALIDGAHDTMRAAKRDLPRARDVVVSTVTESVHGVGEAVEGLIAFPMVVTQYITGTSEHFGETASWADFGKHLHLTWQDNPLNRVANTVNHVVLGGADLLTGHLLYSGAAALGIQKYTPWFTPAPADVRGVARDLTTVAMIFATPAAKAKGYAMLGLSKKTVPVSETSLARQLASATQQRADVVLQNVMAEYRNSETAAFNDWMRNTGRPGFSRGAIDIPSWMLPGMTKVDLVRVFRQTTVSDADLQALLTHADVKVVKAARQVLSERTNPITEGYVSIPGGSFKGQQVSPFIMKATPVTNAEWFDGVEGRDRYVLLGIDPKTGAVHIQDVFVEPPTLLNPKVNFDVGEVVMESGKALLKLVDNPSKVHDKGLTLFSGDRQPVVNVSYLHAQAWIQFQTLEAGGKRVYGFPTDFQYEYVASDRGTKVYGTETGEIFAVDGRKLAHFDDSVTAPVDDLRYQQNLPFGVQTTGNVWRWTQHNSRETFYLGLRGGSWVDGRGFLFQKRENFTNDLKAVSRGRGQDWDSRAASVGFQPVVSIDLPKK